MGKIVVLAEKPSVGRELARVLGCSKSENGCLTGPKYIVTWALGHLVTLADPEVYNTKYKTWKLEDLPMLPPKMELVVIKETSKQFGVVRSLLQRGDVDELIIATDSGREGELVARWIVEKSNFKKPMKRLWISSQTDKAIREGFANLKPSRDYDNLFQSAVARSEADWVVGLNATRALTCKFNAQLNCGRVQTPTLAIIERRENEIQHFVPKKFYGISAQAGKLKLVWQDGKSKDFKTFEKERCDQLLTSLKNKKAEIVEVEKSLKKSYPPQLYDLTELQRDANKAFSFSAKETLTIMQRLYENHKLLTYPRTDSRFLSTDIVPTLKDRVKACGIGSYGRAASKILRSPIQGSKSFVDNSKVTDHHAIIPTEQPVIFGALSDSERKVYDLVVKRFLAALYPPFEYEQTTVKAKIGDEYFVAKGKIVVNAGWKEVYDNQFEEAEGDQEAGHDSLQDQLLPDVKKGEKFDVVLNQTNGQTKPPAPFNEATLLSAMENPVKYMENSSKDLNRIIGETGGLGTVATRADIIEKLFSSFVIEKKGKDIFITSKGRQLLELAPEDLKSPILTAKWEQKLAQIAKGSLNKTSFINEMRSYAQTIVTEIRNSSETFRHDNMTRSRCPECGKFLLEVNGKHGKMLVCQDRECGYREGVARITNARCPNCHKKLELQGKGDGQIFVCSCGYRERLSTFQERRKKEDSKVSKKDVASYLNNQKKDENAFGNSALADALSKLKLK